MSEKILKELQDSSQFLDRDFGAVKIEDIILESKNLDHCVLTGSSFRNVQLKKCQFHLCFMDFSRFESCIFEECRMTLSILACSEFQMSEFVGCDMISVNFNGIIFEKSKIEESDLYYSRYVKAQLTDSIFYDCNLKRVDFSHSNRKHCEFKSCNVQDAYMESMEE